METVSRHIQPEIEDPRSLLSNHCKMPCFDILDPVNAEPVSPSHLGNWLLSRGCHFVTTAEVAELVGVSQKSVPISLQRARDARTIVSVTKGGWVPVPPEYQLAGAPPPLHFIDPMMRHLGHPYYVGFLSSARIHGASHQVPMVLQVVTPALLRGRRIGDSRIQFIRRAASATRAVQQHNVETGRVTVATPTTTILDVVEAPGFAAGLGNVGNVVGELSIEGLVDGDQLAAAAASYPATVAQRAGWIIEHMAREVDAQVELDALAEFVAAHDYTVLDPRSAAEGERDPRWRIVINAEVEHDL